jgi:hypothetical protein
MLHAEAVRALLAVADHAQALAMRATCRGWCDIVEADHERWRGLLISKYGRSEAHETRVLDRRAHKGPLKLACLVRMSLLPGCYTFLDVNTFDPNDRRRASAWASVIIRTASQCKLPNNAVRTHLRILASRHEGEELMDAEEFLKLPLPRLMRGECRHRSHLVEVEVPLKGPEALARLVALERKRVHSERRGNEYYRNTLNNELTSLMAEREGIDMRIDEVVKKIQDLTRDISMADACDEPGPDAIEDAPNKNRRGRQLCRRWRRGRCDRGDDACPYAHGPWNAGIPQSWQRLCKDAVRGKCRWGEICYHPHSDAELESWRYEQWMQR